MIIWIVLLFLAVAGFLFFKFEHHLRLLRIALIALIIVMIYLSMSSVLSSDKVDIGSPRGVVNALYLYVGWLGETTADLFDISKDTAGLVGNAIKVENPDRADLPEYKEDFSLRDWIAEKIRKD